MAEPEVTIVTRFRAETKDQNDALEKMSQDMSAMAKNLDKSVEGFDRLRSVTDGAVDRLKIFGKRGEMMANAINRGIVDPAQRAAKAMSVFEKEAARMARGEKALRGFNSMEGAFRKVRMEMDLFFAGFGELGPVVKAATAAYFALAAAIGGKLLQATIKHIKASDEHKHALSELEAAVADLEKSFVTAIFSADELNTGMTTLTTSLKTLKNLAIETDGEMSALGRTLLNLAYPVTTLAPIFSFLGEAIDIAHRAIKTVTGSVTKFFDKLIPGLGDFRDAIISLLVIDPGGTAAPLAKSYTAKYLKTKKEFDLAVAKADREAFEKRKAEIAKFEKELQELLNKPVVDPYDKKDRGRKGKDPADVALQSLNRGIQQGFRRAERVNKKLFTQQEEFAKKQEDIDRKRREDFERAMEARNKEIKEFEAKTLDARPLAESLGIETTKEGLISLQGTIDQTKDKLLNMGVSMASSVMQGVGAMAHGSKSLSEFGDDMATALGGMAVQWGEFFLGVGGGMLFIPGMAGTGAGLILAGLGLTALGGYLGALGKGPSATASSSTDTRAMARDILPKEDRQRETYVQVFVAGDQIRDPIWRTMNEGIRTGRVQTMGA
jgi:hypothetical protein